MPKALELLKAEIERQMERTGIAASRARIYTPHISPDALVFETTYKSAQDHDAFWADYDQDSPEATAFWASWYEVVERRAGTECWALTEWV
jgi:hypothetical protein